MYEGGMGEERKDGREGWARIGRNGGRDGQG